MEASHDYLRVILNYYPTVIQIHNNTKFVKTNQVYDGMPEESPKLFSATGYPGYSDPSNDLPASLPCFVNSSGPIISIVHKSDYSEHGSLRGWLINFVEFVD